MSAPAQVTVRRSLLSRIATTIGTPAPTPRATPGSASPDELRTPRLILRPLGERDRDAYVDLIARSRAHLARHLPLHRPGETDEDVCERHLAYQRAAASTGRAWRRVVCRHDGSLIGAVNINDIDGTQERTGELNFWLAPDHVGRGYGRESVQAALTSAFSRAPRGLGLAQVRAYVAPDNLVSRRLLDSLDFTMDRASLPVQLNLAGNWLTHHAYRRSAPAPVIALQRLLATQVSSVAA